MASRRYGFNNSDFSFENQLFQNVTMQSTDIYRTIQSGYAELLGFTGDPISHLKTFQLSTKQLSQLE